MTLTEEIKNNSYLKVSNCTDIQDINYAIDCLFCLDKKYGKNNKTLLRLWKVFLDKKKEFESQ